MEENKLKPNTGSNLGEKVSFIDSSQFALKTVIIFIGITNQGHRFLFSSHPCNCEWDKKLFEDAKGYHIKSFDLWADLLKMLIDSEFNINKPKETKKEYDSLNQRTFNLKRKNYTKSQKRHFHILVSEKNQKTCWIIIR